MLPNKCFKKPVVNNRMVAFVFELMVVVWLSM